MKKRIFALVLVLLLFCGCAKDQPQQELNQNLLQNPGFESETGTDITGWQLDRYDSSEPVENYRVIAAADAPQGENALAITSTSYNDVRLMQTVTVIPSSYYCLSAMVKTGEITPRNAESGANISLLQSYFTSSYLQSDTDWTKVTVYGYAGEDLHEVTVCLRLGFYSADCKGEAFFDDVSFSRIEKDQIPEGAAVLSMESFSFDSAKEEEGGQTPEGIGGKAALRGILYFAVLGVLAVFLLKKQRAEKLPAWAFAALLGAALLIRLISSLCYYGFTVDVNCFAAWGSKMASAGPAGFYAEGYFCDYPPLYMFVLGLLSMLSSALNLSLNQGAGVLLLKLPAMLCDILSALVLYKIIKKHAGRGIAVVSALLYAFNPAAVLNSALWGQVDSVLVLLMLLAFYLVEQDRFGWGVLVFFAGLLAKPQAVLFGPVMLFAAVREIFTLIRAFRAGSRREGLRRLLWGLGSVLLCALIFLLLSLWMQNGQSPGWLWNKYMETIGSYNYATLNSFGFMGLIGGQWAPAENTSVLGISYSLLGTLLLAAVLLYTLGLFVYRLAKDREAFSPSYFWLFAALIVTGAVTFSTRTHERYMFPAAAFLLAAFAYFKDFRLLALSGGFALCNFINTASVLYIYEELGVYMDADSPLMIIGSLLTVVLFLALAIVAADLTKNGIKQRKEISAVMNQPVLPQKESRLQNLLQRRGSRLPKVKPRDILLCGVITVLYALLAFTNLGNTDSPQTYWYPSNQTYYAVADLGQEQPVDEIWFNAAAASGSFTLSYSSDGRQYTSLTTVRLRPGDVNIWSSALQQEFSARYIKIETTSAGTSLNELAIVNDGTLLPVEETSRWTSPVDEQTADPANLFDCPESFSEELLHAAPETAWTSGSTYTLTLKEPANISDIYGFVMQGDPYTSVKFQVYNEETLEWVDCAELLAPGNTYLWTRANMLLYDEELKTTQVRITGEFGQMALGELMLLDETGQRLAIAGIQDETGNLCTQDDTVYACFDEPESAAAYQKALELFSRTAPWTVTTCADFVVADFGRTYAIDRGYFYTSVCSGSFSVYYSYDGVLWSEPEQHKVEAGQLYYWHGLPSDGNTYRSLQARFVAVVADTPYLRFLEMGFFETSSDETVIPIAEVRCGREGEDCGCNLFDEQSLVPTRPSYMDSMYFDEIYHARTAYESANGLSIYEWTHPPLGKDMMAWCVSLMGMTPFAWRFAGTLAGVLMLPAMYFLGLLLFKKRTWATMLCALMALDGMHFVQTRIATIDSFGVLFIILMFLFMYWYYSISFYDKPLWKTFIPLGLCGLSFGLGAASKWIGLYAGAGLAVLFFITLGRRYSEYRMAKEVLKTQQNPPQKEYLQHIVDRFTLNTCYTLLFCILVFIIIPAVIYCASYYPYWNAAGESRPWYQIILDNQSAMFNYHSKLTATHAFQSDWYTWPVIYRPMFFYMGRELPAGQMECISSFGNPAIWYMGLVCTLISIGLFVKKAVYRTPLISSAAEDSKFLKLFAAGDETFPDRSERDRRLLLFCLLGLACNLLPWVGISRCIFIYHYFASVPFIMIFTVYIFRNICRYNKKTGAALVIAFLILAAILFAMFLPIWSGAEVSKDYVNTYLKWFPSWVFGS